MTATKLNQFFFKFSSNSRIKSGNPGYFVALNPSELYVKANFSFVASLPDQLTVDLVSKLYNVTDVTKK